jgi:hypothetical protein
VSDARLQTSCSSRPATNSTPCSTRWVQARPKQPRAQRSAYCQADGSAVPWMFTFRSSDVDCVSA